MSRKRKRPELQVQCDSLVECGCGNEFFVRRSEVSTSDKQITAHSFSCSKCGGVIALFVDNIAEKRSAAGVTRVH